MYTYSTNMVVLTTVSRLYVFSKRFLPFLSMLSSIVLVIPSSKNFDI